jgi:hypothetical protein
VEIQQKVYRNLSRTQMPETPAHQRQRNPGKLLLAFPQEVGFLPILDSGL